MKEIKEAIEQLNRQIKCTVNTVSIKSCETAIEALEKQLNGGWIPVSEKLPEEKGNYLVTYGNGSIASHYYMNEFGCWLNKAWIKQVGGITAWTDLPQKYEVKQS